MWRILEKDVFRLCHETWGVNASGTDKLTAQTVPEYPWWLDGEDSPRHAPEHPGAPLSIDWAVDGSSAATA